MPRAISVLTIAAIALVAFALPAAAQDPYQDMGETVVSPIRIDVPAQPAPGLELQPLVPAPPTGEAPAVIAPPPVTPAAPAELPTTGLALTTGMLLAAALLLVGVALVIRGRRLATSTA